MSIPTSSLRTQRKHQSFLFRKERYLHDWSMCISEKEEGRDTGLTEQNKRNWLTSSYASQLPGQVFKEEEGLFCFACEILRFLPSKIL